MTPPSHSALGQLTLPARTRTFDEEFVALFNAHYRHIYRYLDRLSNDSDGAEDLAQETFVRLYRRGSIPDEPSAWLITVGMNLLRNMKSSARRRTELLVLNPGTHGHSESSASSDDGALGSETRDRVRRAVDTMNDREKNLLTLYMQITSCSSHAESRSGGNGR